MKNVEFSTSKGEYYLVDFPDVSSFAGIVNGTIFYYRGPQNREDYPYSLTLKNKVEWIGDPRELTEDEWEDICEEVSFGTYRGFINHQAKGNDFRDIVDSSFKSATKSGISLLKANGVDLTEWKNPIMFRIKE